MWFVYILRCADDSFYVGETGDVPLRVGEHNRGCAAAHTRKRRPVQLAYVERHPSRAICLTRERQLKRWTRQKKEALIAGDIGLLKRS
jgi:predicted GIY-YIG superfamily endonuclease